MHFTAACVSLSITHLDLLYTTRVLKSKSEYLSDEAWQCSDGDYVDLSNLLSSDALITAVYSHGYFTHCRLQMYLGKVHLRT